VIIINTVYGEVEKVIARRRDTVYKLAFTYLKKRSDADDAFQEVFLRYIRNKPEYTDMNHEEAWFVRTTVNVCTSHLRSAWFKKVTPADGEAEYENVPADTGNEQRNRELRDAVLRLSPKLKAVVHLYYYEGYSAKEISQILEIKETTVQTRLADSRKKLAAFLTE